MFFNGDIRNKKVLLHACCGPCSLGAIDPLLSDGAMVTLFFYNPCITDGEYERRLSALEFVAAYYALPLVVLPHDYSAFAAYALPYALDAEGGRRCELCMRDRLIVSADYALEHGYDCYTTTLTVSPHKNSKLIFAIAEIYAGGAPMLPRDFKKNDGFLLSTKRAKELCIYRQNFCGCEYSFAARREGR